MILKTNWIFKGERMIKKAGNNDLETLAKLASEMWHNHSINELINEFSEIMINGKSQLIDGETVFFGKKNLEQLVKELETRRDRGGE